MRRKTEALRDRAVGGDKVSSEVLALTLHERAKSLVDDPASTLFFGRLDLDRDVEGAHRWYIGRRHVSDERGDPVVIDWRAELSGAFYRATRANPLGVTRRRRFGVDRGELTAYEDEHLQDPTETTQHSAILQQEIERPRVGPMRDIVATIQPEQDELVRADATTTVCVQGAPGTGKTAVGLHRAAWLLYAHRDRLSRTGVLVVGPNAAFLDHIGAVLPALGEVAVRHTTATDLLGSVAVKGVDPTERAVIKGDARMATVLRRAVWSHVGEPTEALVVPRGARKWRVPAYLVREVLDELRERRVSYGAAGAMLPQRLAHLVLLAMERSGASPDDRVQDAVARSSAVRGYAGGLWPAVDSRTVLHRLLSDPAELKRHAHETLTEEEQRTLLWDNPARSRTAVRWSVADLALLDELADLVQRTPSLGHVVLDEAQDLSPMQLRAVGRRCATGSATSPKGRRRGPRRAGPSPWPTWASRTASWPCSTGGSGCRPPSSTTPPACCRTWPPSWARLSRCARAKDASMSLGCSPVTSARLLSRRWRAWPANPGRSGSSRRTTTSRRCRSPSHRRGSSTACSAPTTVMSSIESTWCPQPSPRAWSLTTSSSWSRRRSPPRSQTTAPGCAAYTSCSPGRCRP